MTSTALIPTTSSAPAISQQDSPFLPDTLIQELDAADRRAVKSRLLAFQTWQQDQGRQWHNPDLAAYRDDMLADGKAASTVSAHLSTVRSRYTDLVTNNAVRQTLYNLVPADVTSAAERKAFVDEVITRLENATDPRNSSVKTTTKQDTADSEHFRLTKQQAEALIDAPGLDTLRGIRDTAMIALMLCTGLREAELTGLDVGDLRQSLNGELALLVRHGKGRKQRLVPYGDLSWALGYVDLWLEVAGIESGPVFRGFFKGNRRVRDGGITTMTVQRTIKRYPVYIDGQEKHLAPHDLRRTYARRLYDAGTDIVAIQQNLGHADHMTTLKYIGALDASARKPPPVYNPKSLHKLGDVARQRRLDV